MPLPIYGYFASSSSVILNKASIKARRKPLMHQFAHVPVLIIKIIIKWISAEHAIHKLFSVYELFATMGGITSIRSSVNSQMKANPSHTALHRNNNNRTRHREPCERKLAARTLDPCMYTEHQSFSLSGPLSLTCGSFLRTGGFVITPRVLNLSRGLFSALYAEGAELIMCPLVIRASAAQLGTQREPSLYM